MVKDKLKVNLFYSFPILCSLLISVLCAFLIMQSEVKIEPVTVLPETGYNPWFNALFFVFAAGLGATIVYFLLKYGIHRFINLLMASAFAIVAFSLTLFYSDLTLAVFRLNVPLITVLIPAIIISVLVIFGVFFRRGVFQGIILLIFGGATGALLGASIPMLSAVLILVFLAVYDVFAVFYGPVGKIAVIGLDKLPGATFQFLDVHVGLGDLTFYSMLVSRMFLSLGWISCFTSTFGVLYGSYISFKMVERRSLFPGLPFSIFLGLLGGFLYLLFSLI